jgi:flagellar motor switch/type III secretory pathway protein FliN
MSSLPNSSSSKAVDVPPARAASSRTPFRDVPVTIEVLLGKGAMPVRQLLRLEPGAVLRLDSAAGADLVVRATGVPLALGEVVIIEDSVAARVTHVLSLIGEVVS